jgi:protein ImuA
VHEFYCSSKEEASATGGFIAGILSALMQGDGALIWISSIRTIFPPALTTFGISPDRIIFIDVKTEKEVLWVMEEALTCNGLAAVVGELREISFTASRRFQLAVEKSGVTGFIIRCQPRSTNVTACLTRWKVYSLPSVLSAEMPGVGHPSWRVELLKVRNGKPGSWDITWANGVFNPVYKESPVWEELQKKTG